MLFVAQDDEERFFYSLMPAAAAYVLRPGEKLMGKYILKFTGVSNPADEKWTATYQAGQSYEGHSALGSYILIYGTVSLP